MPNNIQVENLAVAAEYRKEVLLGDVGLQLPNEDSGLRLRDGVARGPNIVGHGAVPLRSHRAASALSVLAGLAVKDGDPRGSGGAIQPKKKKQRFIFLSLGWEEKQVNDGGYGWISGCPKMQAVSLTASSMGEVAPKRVLKNGCRASLLLLGWIQRDLASVHTTISMVVESGEESESE